jgi:formiminotetrahydrofolate cyclodeaminase
MSDDSLLHRTTEDLLGLFAAGRRVPGAGSAAALSGALAASLIQAVAFYTIQAAARRQDGAPLRERAEAIRQEAGARSARLRQAADEDVAAFEQYWRDRAPESLERATELPLAIGEECAALVELGLELYDQGSRNARAEACAAVLGAQAAGESAAYVARANLRLAARAGWAAPLGEKADALRRRLRELRDEIEDLGL